MFHSHLYQKVLTAAKGEVTSLDSQFEVNFLKLTSTIYSIIAET